MRTRTDRRLTDRLLILASLVACALGVLATPARVFAQASGGTVVGRVIDARTNDGIGNVSLQVEGTRLGAATGPDGRYRITGVPAGAHTLVALRLGYASLRRQINVTAGQDVTADLTLQVSAVSLDQVVVTGTAGETEKRAIGNVVATIDATAELQKSAAPDLSNLFRSRTAGVDVLPVSGRVGAGPVIQIRGPSSIGLSNTPLIYIDGVRVNNAVAQGPAGTGGLGTQGATVANRLNDISPDDIESIEIIKGPAAATIYGTEAANGVVQIITKKGAGSQAQARAQVSLGTSYFRDAAGRIPTNYDKDKAGNIIAWNGVKARADSGTPLFKNGMERHYNGSVQGGRDQARYYASVGYQNDYGIEPNNNLRSFNTHLNLSTSLGSNTDVAASLNFVDLSSHLGADVGASAMLGAIAGHILLFPAQQGFFGASPDVVQQLYDNAQGVNRFTGSLTANNQLTSWFTQRAVLGLDYTGEDNRAIEHYAPPALAATLSTSAAAGRIGQTIRRTGLITADYSGTAKADLTHSLVSSTSVGGQFNNSEVNSSFLGGLGFPAQGVETVSAAATAVAATQSTTTNTTIGGYGQEQIAWRDRLFLTAALRIDNNSAFGQDFKWATYPKFSASWVMSDEPWWKWSRTLNTFRLRGAYGTSGRQPSTFSALQTFTPVVGPNGTNAVTPGQLGNADLRPERAHETEIGFESNAFNRLSLDFTYFNKLTENEIVNQPVAPSTGFTGSQLVNLGRVKNVGVELQATLQAMERKNFSWSINGNLTTLKNRILSNIANTVSTTGQSNIIGFPIQGFFSKRVVSANRDPATGALSNILCENKPAIPTAANSGGPPIACAQAPFVYVGSPTPSVTGAIGNTITIGKSWRLFALADFKHGNVLFNQNEEIRCNGLAGASLCYENYHPEGVPATYLAEINGTAVAANTADQFIQDASFVKLRELSATYTLPPRFLRLAGPSSITFAARELHTWTKYRGIDPEGGITSSGPTSANDQGITPPLQRFIVTFNLAW